MVCYAARCHNSVRGQSAGFTMPTTLRAEAFVPRDLLI